MVRAVISCVLVLVVSLPAWAANWNQGSGSDTGPKKTTTRMHSWGPVRNVPVTTYVPSGAIKRDLSLKIWSPKIDDIKTCWKSTYNPHKKSEFDQIVFGYRWPNLMNGASKFNEDNLNMLNHIIQLTASPNGDSYAKEKASKAAGLLKKRLLNAAKESAFTRVKWDKKVGSSPSFVTALTVKTTAFVIAGLESMGLLSKKEFNQIEEWVLKLLGNIAKTKMGNGKLSPDHMVAVFSTHILYGAASKNRELFDIGKKEFESYLKKRSISGIGDKVRNDNETMHHAIIAAEILELNGVPAYDFKLKDGNFEEAVSRHATNILDLGSAEVKTQGDPKDKARSILRKTGFGTHVAWIPIYLSRHKNSPSAQSVLKLHQVLEKRDPKPYFGLQIGLHTGCYFGGAINYST